MAEWTKEQITARIRGEAVKQDVDPALALAVATQESYLNPNARGDNGNSLGLFQLQPAAAIDVGVNPQWRHEPGVNIYGGISYLKQKLIQAKGNVEDALRRYNGGGDPNYVPNVMRFFKPGVAEAADCPQAGTYTDADVQQALQALQGPEAPQAPAGGTYTDADVQNALRSLQGTASSPAAGRDLTQELFGTPTQAQPAQVPAEKPITPDARFLRLPSVQQMPLEERTQRFKEFYGLRPEFKEEFLRSEEPPSDLVVDVEKPSPTAPRTPEERQARIREELAAWEQQQGRPWREGDPRMPSEARLGVPDEAPLEEGFTRPSTMIPLIMGMGVPGLSSVPGLARLGPATRGAPGLAAAEQLVGKAGPLITRGARAIGEGLSQTLGWTAGRTAETGEVPSPGEMGTEAAWNIGTGGAIEGLGAARRGMIRRSRGGQAVQQEGQAVGPEAYQQAVEGQRSAIQTARAVPGRYRPETSSWTLYERFGDAAKNQEVDLLTAKTALADVRASRGVLPDGSLRPFPQAVERIATSLEQAADTASVQTIRQELRRLGPLTRHADGNIRGPAKQLYGIYGDAMENSPVANDLLRQANTTFRREMAVQDVQEWLRPGHGVIRIDNQGREVINVGSLLTRLEKTIGDDTLFARSFGADDLQALRQDFGSLAGTPSMPRGGPPAPQSTREAIGERPRFLPTGRGLGSLGGLEYLATSLGVPPGVVTAVKASSAVTQQARYALAYALTSERLRPMVARAIRGDGTLDPRVYGLIMAAMPPAEKKALERETRGKR